MVCFSNEFDRQLCLIELVLSSFHTCTALHMTHYPHCLDKFMKAFFVSVIPDTKAIKASWSLSLTSREEQCWARPQEWVLFASLLENQYRCGRFILQHGEEGVIWSRASLLAPISSGRSIPDAYPLLIDMNLSRAAGWLPIMSQEHAASCTQPRSLQLRPNMVSDASVQMPSDNGVYS